MRNLVRADLSALLLGRLKDEAANIRQQWENPTPGTATRHAVIDDLLSAEIALAIHDAFPRDGLRTVKSFREHKATTQTPGASLAKEALFASQDETFVYLVGELVGIDQLQPDPSLLRGGLSVMTQGHFCNPHVDNSHGPDPAMYRRLNLLYYVTPDWRLANGGNLELWDAGVRHPVTIEARFNRLVIMETNRTSWHSVSPVAAVRERCCVSTYLYSAPAAGEDGERVTSFTGRPEQRFRRAVGAVDNAARQFAKTRLGATRAADRRVA